MKKSVNLYFNSGINTKDKLNAIKELGYDEFFTGMFDGEETMPIIDQIKYAKSIGLGLTMVHCSYYNLPLNKFWEPGEAGDNIVSEYTKQIHKCGNFTKNFVVHLHLTKDYNVSEIGLIRIKELLKVCEKYNVNLAVENLLKRDDIDYIFKSITHPLLKICYDCGHQNFATPTFDVLKEYGKFVSVLHLHDNNGIADEHKILGNGTINLKNLAEKLSQYPNLTLTAEIKNKDEDYKSVLKNNLNALLNLDELIKLNQN